MSKEHEREMRMLRIDGRKPTARDRWKAFWQLYRVARGKFGDECSEAVNSLRWLGFGAWVALASESGPRTQPLTAYPVFLRKEILRVSKRQRLYKGDPDRLQPLDQRVTRQLAQQGVEMTPGQVAEARVGVTRKLRDKAAEIGMPLPGSDYDALSVIRRVMGLHGEQPEAQP